MIVEKLLTLLSTVADGKDGAATDDAAGTRGDSPRSRLFSCPECDVVYVASEMDACSNCRADVREVSSSLSHE